MKRIGTLVVAALALALAASVPACGQAERRQSERLKVAIGVIPIEAALPIWVADAEDLFAEEGLDAKVVRFESAAERNTGLMAGAVQCAQADPVALYLLRQGGYPASATAVLQGATAPEGRMGIVAPPGSSAKSLGDLAGKPVGTSLGTLQEYVVDSLFAQAGVEASDVKKEDIKKIPVRYQLLMSDQIDAAALPEPWLTLATDNGAVLIADDTRGKNLSSFILIANDEWLDTEDGSEAMTRILAALGEAVKIINEDPDRVREILVRNAQVPKEIAETYPIGTYPEPQLPSEESMDDVSNWMLGKKLIEKPIPYSDLVWEP